MCHTESSPRTLHCLTHTHEQKFVCRPTNRIYRSSHRSYRAVHRAKILAGPLIQIIQVIPRSTGARTPSAGDRPFIQLIIPRDTEGAIASAPATQTTQKAVAWRCTRTLTSTSTQHQSPSGAFAAADHFHANAKKKNTKTKQRAPTRMPDP